MSPKIQKIILPFAIITAVVIVASAVAAAMSSAASVTASQPAVQLLEPADQATVTLLKPCQIAYFDERKTLKPKEAINWDQIFASDRRSNSPKEVEFRWKTLDSAPDAKYCLEIADNLQFDGAKTVEVGAETFALVRNFRLGHRYYWRVRTNSHGKETLSNVFSFTTDAQVPRFFKVEGAFNVRDLGGWKVRGGKIRQGLILRGSSLDSVGPEGREMLLHDVGIKVDLDLRIDADRNDSPLGSSVDWLNLPVTAYHEIETDAQTKESYRKIFQRLADAKSYPLYFHCAGGADRAGTLAMLMEAVLGMSESDIWTDYELTVFSHGTDWGAKARERYDATLRQLGVAENGDNFEEKVVQYLLNTGVTLEELARFRTIMIEPAAE